MKKIISAFVLAASVVFGAAAQDEAAAVADSLASQKPLMVIRGAENSMVIQVCGVDISLQAPAEKPEPAKPRRYMTAFNRMEFGFTALTGMANSGFVPATGRSMSTETFSTFHFGMQMLGVNFALNEKRTIVFEAGFMFSIDNYRFSDGSAMLRRVDGMLVPTDAYEPGTRNGKFVTTSVGIPLRMSFRPADHLQFTLTAYSDFGTGLTSVVRSPHIKQELSGLRAYQFGVGAGISYYGVGLFVRYNVSPLFKHGHGVECHPLSFGLSLFM